MGKNLVWFSIRFGKHIVLHQVLTDNIGSSFVGQISYEILEKFSSDQKSTLREVVVGAFDIKYASHVDIIKDSQNCFPKADTEVLAWALANALFEKLRMN